MGTTYKLTDHRSLTRVALTLLATLSLLATQLVGFAWAEGAEGGEELEAEVAAEGAEADPDCSLDPLPEGCPEPEPDGEGPAAVDCAETLDDASCAPEEPVEPDCETDPIDESCAGEEPVDEPVEEEFTTLNVEAAEEPLVPLAVAGGGDDDLGFEIDGNFPPDDADGKDWTTRAGAYDLIVDATSPHTVFSGGSKFGDRADWSWTSGNAPGKADILRLYADVEISGSEAWLRIAAERDGSGGDTWVSFELNQDNEGAYLGDSGVPVTPAVGDLLITFGYPGNNTTPPTVILESWNGTAWVEEGGITSLAAVNTVPLTNPTGQELEERNFLELSIDVSWLFGPDAPCRSFGDSWAFSRSSDSGPSSQMQDFIAPFPFGFDTCASPTLKKVDTQDPANGLPGAVLELYDGHVNPLADGFNDDPVFGPCTTDADGECTGATGLEPGDYTIFEVVPPPGFRYALDRSVEITLSTNDEGTYTLANPPISYLIEIDDDDTNAVGNEHDFEVSLFADFIFDYAKYEANGTVSYMEESAEGEVDLPLGDERIDLGWSGPTDSDLADSTDSDTDGPYCTTEADSNSAAFGTCTVTVESPTVGTGTLTASYQTGLGGPAATEPANATEGGYFSEISDTADKTWKSFDATIESDGENLIDEEHTFKATVHQSGDAETRIGGVEVEVSWDGPVDSWIQGDGDKVEVTEADPLVTTTCTTVDDVEDEDHGTCEFTVSASDAGAGTATIVKLSGTVGGENLVVTGDTARPNGLDTDDAWAAFGNTSDDREATKQWIRFVATVTPDSATNHVDADHTFTIDVVALLREETDTEDGTYKHTRAATDTEVTVTWTPADGHSSTITEDITDLEIDEDGLGATCTTDSEGTCEVTVSSGGDPGSGTLTVTSIADFWVDTDLDGDDPGDGTERRTETDDELTAGVDASFEGDSGTKTWLAFLVSITPDEATNLVDDDEEFDSEDPSTHVFDVEVYVASELLGSGSEKDGEPDWQLLVLDEGQGVTIVADPSPEEGASQVDWSLNGDPYVSDTCDIEATSGAKDATCTITANSATSGTWTIEAIGITLDGIVDGEESVDLD